MHVRTVHIRYSFWERGRKACVAEMKHGVKRGNTFLVLNCVTQKSVPEVVIATVAYQNGLLCTVESKSSIGTQDFFR